MESSAHAGTLRAGCARRVPSRRARPVTRFDLVADIRRRLGLALPAGLHPDAADDSHAYDQYPDKHASSYGGRRGGEQGRGRKRADRSQDITACRPVTYRLRRVHRTAVRLAGLPRQQFRSPAYEFVAPLRCYFRYAATCTLIRSRNPNFRPSSSSTTNRSSGMRRAVFSKDTGYTCVEAETVDAAIELLRTTPVIAAMLDMRLPDGRTGLDVLTDLRTSSRISRDPRSDRHRQRVDRSRTAGHHQAEGLRIFQAGRVFDDRALSRPAHRARSQRVVFSSQL